MESAQGSIDEQNSMEVLKKKYIRSLCEMTARIRSFVLDRSWQTEKWDGIDRMRKEIEEDSEKFDARVVRSERMAGTRENRLKELDKIWNLAYEMYTSLKTAMVRVEGYGDTKWLFTVGEIGIVKMSMGEIRRMHCVFWRYCEAAGYCAVISNSEWRTKSGEKKTHEGNMEKLCGITYGGSMLKVTKVAKLELGARW